MESVTHLAANNSQARTLANDLLIAVDKATDSMEVQHVRIVLEQGNGTGPWRLVISVCPGDSDG